MTTRAGTIGRFGSGIYGVFIRDASQDGAELTAYGLQPRGLELLSRRRWDALTDAERMKLLPGVDPAAVDLLLAKWEAYEADPFRLARPLASGCDLTL